MFNIETSLPYIIAEVGFNHEGDITVAKEMIQAAAESGADAVKFQTFSATDIALPSSPHFEAIKCGEMSYETHAELANTAKKCAIELISTPFSAKAVDLLEQIGVSRYKIASMDLTNPELLQRIAATRKPVIISTGMALLSEIIQCTELLHTLNITDYTLLHCVSDYPPESKAVKLNLMRKLIAVCNCPIGYSDHFPGIDACFIAAIYGAKIIEKHFTLDNNKEGADHSHSATPQMLKELKNKIQLFLELSGNDTEFSTRSDLTNAPLYRRGMYAKNKIMKGETITRDQILLCRPESELGPVDLGHIINSKAKNDIQANEALSFSQIII